MHPLTRTRSGLGALRRPVLGFYVVAATLAMAASAGAQDQPKANVGQGEADRSFGASALSLDPTSPQAAGLPGGITPQYGERALDDKEWRPDLHGFLRAPLTMGIGKRKNANGDVYANPGQSTTVLHSPPVVPDDFETFSYTGVTPTTYGQMNFSYGTGQASANLSVLARQANVSESFLEPASQLGINDLYLRVLPNIGESARMQIFVGAFTSRYGSTGEYDEGRYGTPLIARVNGVGERVELRWRLGGVTLLLDQGFQGQSNKAGASMTPDLWNNYANAVEGTTFVQHAHAGLSYKAFTVGGHFLSAWSQDDRAANPLLPDGSIVVAAGDLRASMGRFGHLYAAFSHTKATHAISVSRIFSVLNTPGGPGLMNNYLGRESDGGDGTGTLTTVGGQYDLSLARLVSYPVSFTGDGPDVFVSLFGMATKVSSPVARADNVTKVKFGGEATYSLLPWFAVSARYDRVAPMRMLGTLPADADPLADDARYTYAVVSPRLIFRTGWNSSDQIVLQYSRWMNGTFTTVRAGSPRSRITACSPIRTRSRSPAVCGGSTPKPLSHPGLGLDRSLRKSQEFSLLFVRFGSTAPFRDPSRLQERSSWRCRGGFPSQTAQGRSQSGHSSPRVRRPTRKSGRRTVWVTRPTR